MRESNTTTPPAQDWQTRSKAALMEAQVASESIGALVSILIESSDAESFPLLEAITACVLRIDRAVDPLILETMPAVSHG